MPMKPSATRSFGGVSADHTRDGRRNGAAVVRTAVDLRKLRRVNGCLVVMGFLSRFSAAGARVKKR
jgi:hypothetical protein